MKPIQSKENMRSKSVRIPESWIKRIKEEAQADKRDFSYITRKVMEMGFQAMDKEAAKQEAA